MLFRSLKAKSKILDDTLPRMRIKKLENEISILNTKLKKLENINNPKKNDLIKFMTIRELKEWENEHSTASDKEKNEDDKTVEYSSSIARNRQNSRQDRKIDTRKRSDSSKIIVDDNNIERTDRSSDLKNNKITTKLLSDSALKRITKKELAKRLAIAEIAAEGSSKTGGILSFLKKR